ncbi:sigma-70 family RNA polymerase sigma factor [Paenibacillus sp. FSL R7-0128]|uniref:sigma-70 family RNA polymerase sigma factor n=1 Tax=Paenibacillus sp. FSL R7-0128 TaxID=2954529 RepID=UPI0030FB527B
MFHADNPLLGPLSRADYITANLPLIDAVINRHYRGQLVATRTPRDDAFNDGVIGLIHAYDRYADATIPFGSFAYQHIYGEIANALSRRPLTGVRVPEWLVPLLKRIHRAGLADEREEVVASELGISAKRARQALRCQRIKYTDALPEFDTRGCSDDYTGLITEEFITRLRPKQQRIIRMLTAGDTQAEVARSLGTSRQAVRGFVLRVRADYERYYRGEPAA